MKKNLQVKDLDLPHKVLCIKDYVNGRIRIRKGSYWKLIEYEEHCDTAHGHPRYMVQHPQFPPVFFNMSDKEYKEKYGGMCFDEYFVITEN